MKKTIVLLSALLSTGLILSGCSFGAKSSTDSAGSGNDSVSQTNQSTSTSTAFSETTVSGITFDFNEDRIGWNKVDGADHYLLSIIANESGDILNQSVPVNYYSMPAGRTKALTVEVTAVSADDTKSKKATKNFFYMAPPVKANFHIKNGICTWDKVANATSYKVYLSNNPTPTTVTEERYDIPDGANQGSVSVMPCSTNTGESVYYSYKSAEFAFNILPTPLISFEKSTKTLTWGSVSGASGYHLTVTLNGIESVFDDDHGYGKDATTCDTLTFTEAGEYKISLYATSDQDATKSSRIAHHSVYRLADPTDIKCVEGDSNLDITFNGSIKATGFKVTQNGTSMGTISTSDYSFPLTSTSDDEETYQFSVGATSTDNDVLDSIGTADLSITKLATPKNIRIENGTILWDAVTKALEYYVSIDGIVYTCSTNSYKITSIGAGSHILKVRAVGDHKLIIASKWANAQNIVKLKAPTNLKVSDSHILSWDAVNSAVSYKVVTDNGAKEENAVGTTYSIPNITSSTTLTVRAVGDGGFIMDSDLSTPISLYTLNAPAGLQVKNGAIAWNSVDHAASYSLMIGSSQTVVTGTTYSMDAYTSGNYSVKVKAIGSGYYFDSTYSTPLTVTILPAVSSVTFDKVSGISWQAVPEATGYRLFIDGVTKDFDKATLAYKPSFITSGTHTIKIRALGNDASDLIASPWKETTFNSNILAAPTNIVYTRTSTGVTVTADIDSNATAFVVVYGGTEHTSTTGSVLIPTTTAGSVLVYCYCKGDGTVYVDSEHTETKTLTVLAKPSNIQITSTGANMYVATWDDVTSAEKYNVVVRKYTSETEYVDSAVMSFSSARTDYISTSGYIKLAVTVTAVSSDPLTLASDSTSQSAYIS